jgi:hypothetical protein
VRIGHAHHWKKCAKCEGLTLARLVLGEPANPFANYQHCLHCGHRPTTEGSLGDAYLPLPETAVRPAVQVQGKGIGGKASCKQHFQLMPRFQAEHSPTGGLVQAPSAGDLCTYQPLTGGQPAVYTPTLFVADSTRRIKASLESVKVPPTHQAHTIISINQILDPNDVAKFIFCSKHGWASIDGRAFTCKICCGNKPKRSQS